MLPDGDIEGRAVMVDADGDVRIKAKCDVTLDAGADTVSLDANAQNKGRGFATKKTITTEDHIRACRSVAGATSVATTW